jgi:hypothetical protein
MGLSPHVRTRSRHGKRNSDRPTFSKTFCRLITSTVHMTQEIRPIVLRARSPQQRRPRFKVRLSDAPF